MKKIFLIGLIIILAITAIVWLERGNSEDNNQSSQQIPEEDPLDAVNNFYNAWLEAVASTSTDPVGAGLTTDPFLSSDVQTYVQERLEDELDPVICQTLTPPRVGAKILYQQDMSAQVQVLARGFEEKSSRYAAVTLAAVDGDWQVSEITCFDGETAPDKEFDFNQEGQLLKNVPEPLNSDYWHLVFSQDGIDGHTVPLFFDENSYCADSAGERSVCDESTFIQTTRVTVKGDMNEAGLTVREMNF